MGSCARERAVVLGGRLFCMGDVFVASGHWTASQSQAGGVAKTVSAPKHVRSAFSLSCKVQCQPECVGIQEAGYGTPLHYTQRRLARDCGSTARGGTH